LQEFYQNRVHKMNKIRHKEHINLLNSYQKTVKNFQNESFLFSILVIIK